MLAGLWEIGVEPAQLLKDRLHRLVICDWALSGHPLLVPNTLSILEQHPLVDCKSPENLGPLEGRDEDDPFQQLDQQIMPASGLPAQNVIHDAVEYLARLNTKLRGGLFDEQQ